MYRKPDKLMYESQSGSVRLSRGASGGIRTAGQPQPLKPFRPRSAAERKFPLSPGSDQQSAISVLRKLKPAAKPPVAALWERLSSEDRQILTLRLTEPAECLYHECFQRANAESVFLGRDETAARSVNSGNEPASPTPTPAATKGLTIEMERVLFLRFNYCRFRVMKILRRSRGRRLTLDATHELLKWERAAMATRDRIVQANLPLVLAMAKRARPMDLDLSDLISEGNLALLRSVDKFDVLRGFKFSTYACRAIITGLARSSAQAGRYSDLFPAEFDPTLEKSDFIETKRAGLQDDCVDELKSILSGNLAELSPVERRVLRARFALGRRPADEATEGQTLKEVAETIGVTRERVRQIQNKALGKLRKVLEERALAN